jgi:hypothetical protein
MANEHPQVVEALAQLMQKYIANGRSTPGDIQKNAVEIRLGKAAKKSRR